MSQEQALYSLNKLRKRYITTRLLEILLVSSAAALLTKAFAGLVAPSTTISISLVVAAGIAVFIARFSHYKLHQLSPDYFTRYLNKAYPQLKESADLLTRDENVLTNLQRIQKAQTLHQFNVLYPEVKLPNQMLQSLGIFAVCSIIYVSLSGFAIGSRVASTKTVSRNTQETTSIAVDTIPASIRSLSVNVTPPAYTQLKSFAAQGRDLIFPEGSTITWNTVFSKEVANAKVIFSGRDSTDLKKTSGLTYSTKRNLNESGFYQIQWTDQNKIHRSDYYRIEVIADQPPKVAITNLEQFTKLRFDDNPKVAVTSSLGDDYGLSDAHIIATVSKGSGESVKFREEKLRFTTPQHITGKQVHAEITLNLIKLGLEPGDEIYFYVEAFDNKTPEHNRHRTETFFIALQDTTAEISIADEGLGVDLMPEYFRSQRQIIIDTEKLLREKKKLTKKEFNSTSNELGYDQKVLRLRYGQFVGEEADSGIGHETVAAGVEESEHAKDEKDIIKEFGHAHDTENEHNLVGPTKDTHGHEDAKDPNEKEDPLKDFIHQHDDTEEATFLFQSVKAKLKAALSIMWDAELHLRLFDPAKSLPYQYKALNLLKEISNDSRIYVQRSGFDPPPLKEEKRLSADLTEIKTSTNRYTNPLTEKYPNIRKALLLTEGMLQEVSISITPEAKKTFNLAGQELSIEAIEKPGVYLKGLSLLKSLTEEQVASADIKKTLMEVRSILWKVLPQQAATPSKAPAAIHSLDQKFLQSLDKSR